jgi:hypothetical protein
MTSIYYNTFEASPWHRRVLSRFRSALATRWNRFIYKPFQLFTCILIRWLYGPKIPLFVYDQMSADEIAPVAPLPLMRKRRLSITEFTLPGPPRTISTYNRLFGKLAEIQHLGTTSSTPSETPTLLPRFHEEIVGRHDKLQCTATQEQCPLITKLPLELRLQIYGYVLGNRTLHIIPSHVPSLTPPPRFSLRTYPFHRRLDFEICKNPGLRLDLKGVCCERPEICTRESDKNSDFRINRGFKKDTDERKALRTKSFLQKYERKDGPLALLKTCRVMYVLGSL